MKSILLKSSPLLLYRWQLGAYKRIKTILSLTETDSNLNFLRNVSQRKSATSIVINTIRKAPLN